MKNKITFFLKKNQKNKNFFKKEFLIIKFLDFYHLGTIFGACVKIERLSVYL